MVPSRWGTRPLGGRRSPSLPCRFVDGGIVQRSSGPNAEEFGHQLPKRLGIERAGPHLGDLAAGANEDRRGHPECAEGTEKLTALVDSRLVGDARLSSEPDARAAGVALRNAQESHVAAELLMNAFEVRHLGDAAWAPRGEEVDDEGSTGKLGVVNDSITVETR